jgi:hypothetical protein
MLAEAISSTTAALWLSLSCPVQLGCIHTYFSLSCNLCAPCGFAASSSSDTPKEDIHDPWLQLEATESKVWTPFTRNSLADNTSYKFSDMPSLLDVEDL